MEKKVRVILCLLHGGLVDLISIYGGTLGISSARKGVGGYIVIYFKEKDKVILVF